MELQLEFFITATRLAAGYAVLGLAWVTLFRATRVLNLAAGALVVVAGFGYYDLIVVQGMPHVLAAVVVSLAVIAISLLMPVMILRRLEGQESFATVIITLGASVVVLALVSIRWGGQTRPIPGAGKEEFFALSGTSISHGDFALVASAVIVGGALTLLLRYTRIGVRMRAVAESPVLAEQMGIDSRLVKSFAWGLSGLILAIAGITYAYSISASQSMADIGLRGLVPAVLGGLYSVPGTLLGALLVGSIELLAIRQLDPASSNAVVFGLMLIVLVLRPAGLTRGSYVTRA